LTAIICTISPASINFFQTLSTLKFAQRASSVKYLAEQNQLNENLNGMKGMEQKISRLTSRLKEKEA